MIITPKNIINLNNNEIFVFGSNEAGRHGKGAAKTAMKWGAKYGQAEGLQGMTYGIPTVNSSITKSLSIDEIKKYVDRFINFVNTHEEYMFLITEIGCGLAGKTANEIAPLFKNIFYAKNISLPLNFFKILTQ